ncbi:MAG: BTAD domain-containing putative transcriptional regulator [Micropruina sp.]|uniref:BTAD domain-containing putative transcriptional regulator n=1 Tax=Micropruina sp. TaxID=2737536 RepID=UPI0039E653EE
MLTVGVLGAVEVRRDGLAVALPAGKTTELLARLALDAGHPVRVDVLIDDLWGVPTGRNTLQAKVSQLRRSLAEPGVVRALDGAYLLDLEPDAVDAERAVRLADAAERAQLAGDAATALDLSREGVVLFRGDLLPLAGSWAAVHRTRLDETRWSLIETMVAARVDLGAGAELVAELEGLIAQQPLREGLWRALITVLYRSGRQSDALAAYRRIRERLAGELGLEPGPQLRRLELDVLRHHPRLGEPRLETARPGNVVRPPQPLVGRDRELASADEAMEQSSLVTLIGPAGVGKTRLATEIAARSTVPGGAWLIRLESLDDSSDLLQAIAHTLRVPSDPDAVRDRLTGADTLLVLDNCEHLIAQAAATVDRLLGEVPRLSLLATSQVPLGLDAEQVLVLPTLAPAESRRLFEQRARRHRRGFTVEARHEQLLADVCARLDHLPLAIELAAARVRSLPVDEIARRLDNRFALLRDPGSHQPPRRRALEAAIAWSYELLFPDERRGLWALSCFAGGATLSALEAVLAALEVPDTAVLDTITRLVDRSLVVLDDGSEAAPRYRLLDSVRLFAAGRLAESGAETSARLAHARWYADRAAWCAGHIVTPSQPDCLAYARAERADIDAALAWSRRNDPSIAAAIGLGMAWTWVVLGDGAAGAARVRDAVATAAPADRARGLLAAVWLEASAGDLTVAERDLLLAAALAEALSDDLLAADVRWYRAFVAIQRGDADAARSESGAALRVYRQSGSDWSIAAGLLLAAYGALMAGDVASADRDAGAAVALIGATGDAWGLIHGNAILGGVAQGQGRLGEAATAFEAAAEAARRLGFAGQAALHRASLARCLARAGDPGAEAAFEQALTDATAVADGRLQASVRLQLARLLRSHGDPERATRLVEQNAHWYARSGGGDLMLLNRIERAALAGDEEALTLLADQARAAGDIESVVAALDALALCAARSGDLGRARDLLGRADEEMAAAPYLLQHTERYDAVAARALTEPAARR